MNQQPATIEKEIIQHIRLEYLRYLPPNYGKQPGQKWPLILFLHGAGERGEDINLVKKHGIARVVEERDLPFVTISPQCPVNHWWSDVLPVLDDLISLAVDTLNVDPRRVYLTGLSMGGYGTWHMACEYPNRFAAIAPICGGGPWHLGFPERVSAITRLPTWVFHGAKDDVVPMQSSQVLVDQLRACDGDVRFTVYPEADHDSWTETYNNPALYDWFLSHVKAA
jgi:predicted peptidase